MNIFIIWVGNNKPSYVDFAVENYRKVNPDFKVNLVEVNSKVHNEDFIELGKIMRKELYVEKFSEFIYNLSHNYPWIKENFIKPKKLSFVCDLLRNYLAFKYGGILIDADTFPTKPFDKDFLNLINDQYDFVTPKDDVYLIYAKKGILSHPYSPIKSHYQIPNVNAKASKKFEEYKKKFLECKLQYGESLYPTREQDYNKYEWKYYKYYYFDHYFIRTWKQNKQEEQEEQEFYFKFLNL